MPCYYTGSREGDEQLLRKELTNELDKATRLLCTVCKTADRFPKRQIGQVFEDAELAAWWEAHKAQDAKRKGRT